MVKIEITPETIIKGRADYSDNDFRKDVYCLRETLPICPRNEDGLSELVRRIIEDVSIENEPDQFLKPFYKLYYYIYDLELGDNNYGEISQKLRSLSIFTYSCYLIFASKLKERFDKEEIDYDDYISICEELYDSYDKFMCEFDITEMAWYSMASY
jgi:hypothetical protein